MATLFAQPYSISASGFCFDGLADYQAKYDANHDQYGQHVEEYEIQIIEVDTAGDAQLFEAIHIDQSNLPLWFDDIESKTEYEKSALFYLTSWAGYGLAEALEKLDEVSLHAGSLLDSATELFDECYAHAIPENLRNYIDYAAFANDCRCNGDFVEFDFAGQCWTCTNASGI